MAQMSRRCVPYTPFDRPLEKATVAIVSAGGVHRRDQEPFNIADELGDLTYRIIGPDDAAADLMVTHHHYDHGDADRDVNVVFPIERLRELAAEGVIGGVAKIHVSFMGYSMRLKQMYEETAPAIAAEIEKASKADAVLLTGG
jgi:D-proline reductase (dithiol) PrdB